MRVAIIGGGAAGFFAALSCAEHNPACEVTIFESSSRPLAKVAISGGGRCNVTHNCFEASELVKNYPRGSNELRGPFSKFQPADTVRWFSKRGVELKTEPDGRMFPVSDSSQTVIDCLLKEASNHSVTLKLKTKVTSIIKVGDKFELSIQDERLVFDAVILASGGSPGARAFASGFGHTISECAPSLFTFKISDPILEGMAGIDFPHAQLTLQTEEGITFKQNGPLLITHWGLSGPAVLKLSAWAARELARSDYSAELRVQWLGTISVDKMFQEIVQYKNKHPSRLISSNPLWEVPRRFWERVVSMRFAEKIKYADTPHTALRAFVQYLTATKLVVQGKGEFKEEFVTCGGISLREIDMRTMQSKIIPGLYAAGEILDIDGITGGFNFQNAWTTGWLAGKAAATNELKASTL